MDEKELSSKDKLFKKAIVEIYEELEKVKDQKKDKFIYTVPKVDLCNWGLVCLKLIVYDNLCAKSYFEHFANIWLHQIYKQETDSCPFTNFNQSILGSV